jgi:hypothetical protein
MIETRSLTYATALGSTYLTIGNNLSQSLGDAQYKRMQEIPATIKKRILSATIRRDELLYLKTLHALE